MREAEERFLKKTKNFGEFPYTHGDTIEEARAKAKDEMRSNYRDHL